ncbi:MAG: hypothetical protein ACRDVL_04475, partial [Acidimicrobiia bacterium]
MPAEMLPFITALVVGCGQTLVVPSHLEVLSPIAAEMSARGGNTGGIWGLVRGMAVLVVGGLVLVTRAWAGLGSVNEGPAVLVGVLLWVGGWAVLIRSQALDFHDHPHVHPDTSHEHVHSHRGPGQTHDHARPGFAIPRAAASPSNLVGVLPALG